MRQLIGCLILLIAVAGAARGDHGDPSLDPALYETILVPIITKFPAGGAMGSSWQTALWVRNSGTQGAWFTQEAPICSVICDHPSFTLAGLTTIRYDDFAVADFREAFIQPSILLHVQRDFSENVHFHLHMRELSRQTGGVEIPVVRESEFLSQAIELLNVPNDPALRVLLRAYSPIPRPGHAVVVRVFDLQGNTLLGEQQVGVDLAEILDPPKPQFYGFPGYGQLAISQENFPNIAGHTRLRIEVSPAVPDMKFWTFVAITHNETQQVTTITPQ